MPRKTESKEIAPTRVDFDNPALAHGLEDMLEVLNANLGGGASVGLGDLDRVRVPNGSKSFIVPSLEGEESESQVEGVVLLSRNARAYWPSTVISDEAPQCYSDDGIVGHGTPGGECASCPLAQFGSAAAYVEGAGKDSNSQACKQSVIVFLLTEDGFLPKVLRLAPTSLRGWRQYMIALTGRRLHHLDVMTRFEIEIDKNDLGQPFSRVIPKFGGRLSDESKEQIRALAQALTPKLRTVRVGVDGDRALGNGRLGNEPTDQADLEVEGEEDDEF